MGLHKITIRETDYNRFLSLLRYIADNAGELCDGLNGETVTEIVAVAKKQLRKIRKNASVNRADFDFETGDVYWVRVLITDEQILEIARIVVYIMIAQGNDYNIDYTAELIEDYQAFLANRKRRLEEEREAWCESHCEPKKQMMATELAAESHELDGFFSSAPEL